MSVSIVNPLLIVTLVLIGAGTLALHRQEWLWGGIVILLGLLVMPTAMTVLATG